MHSDAFAQALHAAELAGLAAYSAAVLARAQEADPSVVALRIDVQARPGEPRVMAEFITGADQAVGGFAL